MDGFLHKSHLLPDSALAYLLNLRLCCSSDYVTPDLTRMDLQNPTFFGR